MKPTAFGYKGFYFSSERFVSKMDMWAAVGEGRQKERSLYEYLYACDQIIVASSKGGGLITPNRFCFHICVLV